jgi:tryptophan-rich sensory protein
MALGAFAGLTGLAALAGSWATRRGLQRWYPRLDKPRFTPPRWVFGPVWSGLYALMAGSAWRVWRLPSSPRRTRALAWWGTQLALNAAWSPLFFGARWPRAALADLALLLGATAGYTATVRELDRPAAWMMAPYLAWTGFAGVLNAEIARRNPA